MLAKIECEVALLGWHALSLEAGVPEALARPGAGHLLRALPPGRWGIVTDPASRVEVTSLLAGELDDVPLILGTDRPEATSADYLAAAATLAADPTACLAITDTPEGIDAGHDAGMQVLAIAHGDRGDPLAAADLVVPSLLSVSLLGTHPFLVLEVDALPGLGGAPGR